MLRRIFIITIITATSAGFMMLAGCESDAQTGAATGALIGAGVGQLAGGDTEATLIGAAVGGGAGYMIGNEGDKKKAREQAYSSNVSQDSVTVWITNSNGSKTPVTLKRHGAGYIGPRGEVYQSMPSDAALRKVYGF